jgi:hypothetical protein
MHDDSLVLRSSYVLFSNEPQPPSHIFFPSLSKAKFQFSRSQTLLYSSLHYFTNHTGYLVRLVAAKLPALDFVPLQQTFTWTQRHQLRGGWL